MSAFLAVFFREMYILRRRVGKQIGAAAVGPFLYILTFGYALGDRIQMGGKPYLEFLVPGLVAMASMTQAFGMATEINIARFYSAIFEEVQASPASRLAYVLGEVASGLVRVALGSVVVLGLGACFGIRLHYGIFFWLAVFLNGFAFASLAVACAMVIRSHADQSLLSSFIITPMAFLGGTFFSIESMPGWIQRLLGVLPLTHASMAIRAAAVGDVPDGRSLFVLGTCGFLFFTLAHYTVGRAKD